MTTPAGPRTAKSHALLDEDSAPEATEAAIDASLDRVAAHYDRESLACARAVSGSGSNEFVGVGPGGNCELRFGWRSIKLREN
jgi:hypothetical protein